MPHIITGEIRKEPFTKEGSGNKGPWKMYAVELSERYKEKEEVKYTNYRITIFATENQKAWYDEAFQVGRVVSFSGDTIKINQREHNGTLYTTLELDMPKLIFSQRGGGQGQQQQPRQQQQQQQRQPQQQQSAPMDFDDDIPF